MIKVCDREPGDSEATIKAYAAIKEAIQDYYSKDKTINDVLEEHWKDGGFDKAPYGFLDKLDYP